MTPSIDTASEREAVSRKVGRNRHSYRRRSRVHSRVFPFLLVAPTLLLFFAVVAYPFAQSLLYGLFDESLLDTGGARFTGFENIASLLSSSHFWSVVQNTVVFVAGSTLGAFAIALAAALALNTGIRARTAWRSALLVPWFLPGVVVAFLWRWIFDANYGLANGVLDWIGIDSVNWLDSPSFAMVAVIIGKIWHSFPWMMLLILAALQGVPAEVYDAAAIDGASGWKQQVYVVLPQIRPAIALTLLLETIWGLQHFELPYVMTGGGPVGATTTLSVDLYQSAFHKFDLGQAGAIGILWTALMAGVVAIYLFYSARQEREAQK